VIVEGMGMLGIRWLRDRKNQIIGSITRGFANGDVVAQDRQRIKALDQWFAVKARHSGTLLVASDISAR
jgi:hypothetical protein